MVFRKQPNYQQPLWNDSSLAVRQVRGRCFLTPSFEGTPPAGRLAPPCQKLTLAPLRLIVP
jgi:hypothetical protein